MLSFFLKIMNQKCGSYVCVQLLQTLNILFENIRNETSICKSLLINSPIGGVALLSLGMEKGCKRNLYLGVL